MTAQSSPTLGRASLPAPLARAPGWTRRAVALAGLAAVTLSLATIAVDAAAARSPLVSHGGSLPPGVVGPLAGLGSPLGVVRFLGLLLVMVAGYGALVWANALSIRVAAAVIVGLHLVVLVAPPLFGGDIFSYLAYARLGVLHGIGPYAQGPDAVAHDAAYRYVPPIWRHTPSAYGPLFTLLSYPAGLLGLAGGVWAIRSMAVAASLATVALGALCAQRRGRDRARAALVVGANPMFLIFGTSGAHNDLLMLALTMGGVLLALDRRDALGSAATVAAAAVKATAVVVLPFMLVGRRRPLRTLAGAASAAAAISVAALVAFGTQAAGFVSVVGRQQDVVSKNAFTKQVADLIGLPGRLPSLALLALSLAALAYLLFRVWRGSDWVSGAGWALLALAVTTSWLMAWYLLWALPLAVAGRDRRLLAATLTVQGIYLVHRMGPLLAPA